uniref:Uncharacterized protein n=1 Tax=Tetranychus urticae TaxID=32264 RepID=T1KHP9_TETUR
MEMEAIFKVKQLYKETNVACLIEQHRLTNRRSKENDSTWKIRSDRKLMNELANKR